MFSCIFYSRQPAAGNHHHSWLVRLVIDLATFCDIWNSKALVDAIFSFLIWKATPCQPTTLHPYKSIRVVLTTL